MVFCAGVFLYLTIPYIKSKTNKLHLDLPFEHEGE
jgi:hypothetical protein